ncbi:MAG: transglycosylase SLT domain-containing protein, partial [Chloroflexi bacterium]|nr:transglycosylase SLT domain-containing protein [Chloroflexota bacterium]
MVASPARRRAASVVAIVGLLGATACQVSPPPQPAAPTAVATAAATAQAANGALPVSTAQSATGTQPAAASQPTGAAQGAIGTQPAAAAQSATGTQPAAAAEGVSGTQPTVGAQPASTTPPTGAPATLGSAQPTQVSAQAAQPPSAQRPSPTPLPFLPVSTLPQLPPPQAATVQQVRSALAAGDDSRALSLIQPLRDQLSGDQQQEASLLYGQAQLGNQQFDDALATADALLKSTQRQDLQSAARLLRGEALRGLQRYDEAATEMRAVADANPLVAAAVRLELEDMWLAADRPDQAAIDGQQGLLIAEPRLLKIDLAEKLGGAEVALNQTDAAMDAYRQLLTAAGTKGYLGEQLYNIAAGEAQLGRTDDAINALRTSISQFPRSRKAPDAVQLLEDLGGMRPEDRFYAGIIRYLFWNFAGARADFDAYIAAFPDGDNAVEARYYRGLSSPAKTTTTQLLQLAADEPDDDFAPMALLEAGKAQEELSDYASAASIYEGLVAKYPTRDAGMAGAFRLGLAKYMLGDFDGALATWSDLLARQPSSDIQSQTLYWTGKALASNGDAASARAKYAAAAAVRPVDYYVMRAEVALNPPPSSKDFDPSSISASDDSEVTAWFARNGLDLKSDAQAAAQDPAYIRATALVQHGLYKQANWEYEIFLTTYADKPDRLYWLAERFGEMGLPNAELKLGSAALDGATAGGDVSVLDVPRALARVASPLVFPDLVTSTAKQRNIDPLLFTSLMHQESDFDPYVESVAKAKGLTQIIPKTGNEIAAALGINNFAQEDLYKPKLNVQFGAYYFSQRLKRNGSVDRALASYNAGDGNVDTWTTPG